MTISRTHRTMIVPAALAGAARELAAAWPEGGNMFITPLCPIDAEDTTPTHYISTGLIDKDIADVMPWVDYSGEEPVQHAGDPEALAAMLHEQHPDVTPEQLEGIIAACDISTQEPYVAAARMGLRILV
jgi:hypothetical protein